MSEDPLLLLGTYENCGPENLTTVQTAHLTRHLFLIHSAHLYWCVTRHWLKCLCASSHPCVMRLCDCLFSLRPSLCSLHCLSLSTSSSWTLTSTFSSSMWMSPEQVYMCTSPNEESGPLANNAPLTGYEPNFLFQIPLKFSSRSNPATRGPRTCMTWRSVTTPSAERSLHHRSLRSEKNQRAIDKLITLLKKVCCQVSRCLSVM